MNRSFHHYSPELKQRIVDELEAGRLTLREAAQDARTTVSMVRVWLDEFGRYKPKRDVVEVVMRSEQERIAALEKALAEAHLRLQVYDELIVQANKHFKTDLKKNFGPTRSEPAPGGPVTRPSAPSATSLASHGTRTISASGASGPPA
jgi:transposase-like protein